MNEARYHLRLANGQEWQITADGESEWISEGLAHIAELKRSPANSGRSIIFVKNGPEKGLDACRRACSRLLPGERLPESGWTSGSLRLLEFWSHPEAPYVIGRPKDWEATRLLDILKIQQSLYPIIAGVIDSGGLPMHAALVERDGKGVLIAARGGTGKSTCCNRIPQPWQPLCDDMPLLVRDDREKYHAHPFPTWSDYTMCRAERTWDVQKHVPLAAIFFLRQAEKDEAEPIGRGDAALSIYNSSVEANRMYELDLNPDLIKERRSKMLENACRVARDTPAFKLGATLTGEFWKEMEKALKLV